MPDRQLLLLRHAKAVPGKAGMADFDRHLAERGQKAAKLMGRYLAEHDLVPDLVLCSPARTYVDVLQAGAGLGERPQASVRDLPFSKGEDEADRQRQHGWMR